MRAALTALLLSALPLQALAFDTTARFAWVYDVGTGTVLLAKNADQALPPASMSKLMTVYMLFEAVRDGRLQMDTRLPVSTKAREMKGSTMALRPRAASSSTACAHASIVATVAGSLELKRSSILPPRPRL